MNKLNNRFDPAQRQLSDSALNAPATENPSESELHTLQAELDEMRKTADLNTAQIARLTAERDAWMQELFESNRHAAHLAHVRQQLTETIDRLKQENHNLQNLVNAIYASTSWKFARPVRAIAKVLGRR